MDSDHLVECKIKDLKENYTDSQLKCLLVEYGLANVPLNTSTKNLVLKQLAKKILNISSSNSDGDVVTVSESSAAAAAAGENTLPKVESNNNMDGDDIRKNLEEVRESLSFCLSDECKTHYAVCIPGQDDSITVHSDFREVLKLMKEHKAQNPRMLSFRNKTDAELFAEQHTANEVCEGSTIKTSYPEERAEVELGEVKLFPSLTTPQLSEFRIHLEKGNVHICRERILSNPRYLIGNGDMPTILKEGPRYNAMHASVISGQLESCRLIMEMVNDIEFLKRMYITQIRAEENSQRLTDLYLNTPDKTANKTPLHFASEKGMVDIVAFLVTFQACIRNFNRHLVVSIKKGEKHYETRACTGKTPEEVACSRYNGPNPATVKAKIINLIQEGVCYVPLIKSDALGPKVGDLYSPTSPYKLVSEIEDVFTPVSQAEVSLKDIRNMKVWAIAGPMSPQEGQEFRRAWKSPRMKRANFKENLKITDGDRGFEHYGRELADNHATSWQEYWPFLNQFADLRSESGLEILESFFKKQRVIVTMQTFFKPPVQFVSAEAYRVNVAYVLKPSLDSSISLEGENFVSLDSTVSNAGSSLNELDEQKEIHPALPVKEIVDVHNKSSPGILSSLWGGLAKIKGYLSQNASKTSSSPIIHIKPPEADTSDQSKPEADTSDQSKPEADTSDQSKPEAETSDRTKLPEAETSEQTKPPETEISDQTKPAEAKTADQIKPTEAKTADQNKPTELGPADRTKSPESEITDKSQAKSDDSSAACHPAPKSVLESHGDKADVKSKDRNDPCQTTPLSVRSMDSSLSSGEANNSALPDPKYELASQQSLTKGQHAPFTDENETSIPEAFACRSHMDNSLTPRHWKYRTSRHSLDSPEKSADRDSESPSRRSSGARKYHSDSEKDGESPVRRASRLTKHHSDSHHDQSRLSPSKKDSKSSISFNTKMDSLCRHLDKFSIVSPDRTAPSLSPSSASCDMTSSFRSVFVEPSLHIFTGKMFGKFTINLNMTRGNAHSKPHLHDLPIACLRQDSEVGTVLTDIFLPQAISDSTWLSSVLDEQSHCEIVKNVWVDFLTVFPDSENAKKVCSLPSDEILNVVIEGLHEDNKLSSKNIKELYKESRENTEEKVSMTVEMRVIRVDTIPKKDVFVCGSVPTKVDADIYSTLNSQTCQIIRGQSHRFPFCKQWLDSMDRPGKEFISSLPSPSRVIRLERRELFPISPLVLNDTKFPPQMTSTPKSSRVTHTL